MVIITYSSVNSSANSFKDQHLTNPIGNLALSLNTSDAVALCHAFCSYFSSYIGVYLLFKQVLSVRNCCSSVWTVVLVLLRVGKTSWLGFAGLGCYKHQISVVKMFTA